MAKSARRTLVAVLAAALLFSCAGAPDDYPDGDIPEPEESRSREGLAAAKSAEAPGGPSDRAAELFPPPGLPSPSLAPSPEGGASSGGFAGGARPVPGQSGLKAGYSDDNEQFNLFLGFLEKYASTPHEELRVAERILVKVEDEKGLPVANAEISVSAGGRKLASGRSYSDGSFALYPLEYDATDAKSYLVEAAAGRLRGRLELDRAGPRSAGIRLQGPRAAPEPLPVDLVFVLDTTGSMGEEIERLRDTIDIINANLAGTKPKPALRFGLVLYRDQGDDYVTQVFQPTADLERFRRILATVRAGGGGDTPEDLELALEEAVERIDWNEKGLRLGFVITDAPAQLPYERPFSYATTARKAAERGIKLFGVGTGGLPLEGEYLLRQVAQYTRARYIFLTYGERGESEGGSEGSVSHHSGANFTTDKLEAVVIRFVREEIALQGGAVLDREDPYFTARKVEAEAREETLGKLFAEALGNLNDYAAVRIPAGSRLAVLPISLAGGGAGPGAALAAQAEYFGARLLHAAAESKAFTLVDRARLQEILSEIELQLSGALDEAGAAKVGRLLGAEYLLAGRLFAVGGAGPGAEGAGAGAVAPERYELFLELLRVETGEIVAATKARIDPALGL